MVVLEFGGIVNRLKKMNEKLLWVVQNNLYNEDGYVRFIKSLKSLGSEYIIIKPIPFTNIIVPDNFNSVTDEVSNAVDPITDNSRPIMICGATSLNRIAKARNWKPGTLLNENFHYSKWKEHWGYNLLNDNAVIGTVLAFKNYKLEHDVFVRPTEDTKAISGTLMNITEFSKWIDNISLIEEDGNFTPLHKNTEIVISPIKKIYNECRLFVVDGKVVTASMYKIGNRVYGDSKVDERYINFANHMTDIWEPSMGFVIDIADTPNGLKVIEINNINSAGFYACDTSAIINAIECLYQ